jgi:hypothetical protein
MQSPTCHRSPVTRNFQTYESGFIYIQNHLSLDLMYLQHNILTHLLQSLNINSLHQLLKLQCSNLRP